MKDMTRAELRNIAKALKIKGWWDMNKEDLIKAIEAAQNIQKEEVKEVVQPEKENVPEPTQKRKNHKRLIEYNGETKTLTAWAKELGIRHQTLYNRIVMKGMDPAEAFEKQVKHNG